MTGEDAVHRRISHGRPPGMDIDGKINHVWNLGSQLVKGQRVKPPRNKRPAISDLRGPSRELKTPDNAVTGCHWLSLPLRRF